MNSSKIAQPKTQKIIVPGSAIVTILLILLIIHRDYPFVGHDYAYFIPRLVDTGIHMRLHGLSVQWYTPSFGGGLPAFPNPQHMEYSLVQLITLLTTPWLAVLVSTAIISLLGFYFFYKFLNQNLELGWMSSTLGAIFFIANGFYIEHLIVGHLGYQLFPLFGVILYVLTKTQKYYLFTSAVMAIIISMMIHQAGFYLIVIVLLSTGMTLPLLYMYKPEVIDLKYLARLTIPTLVLIAAMAGSKVYASISFMQHFPREVFDEYNVGVLQGIIGMVTQLLGVMNFTPLLILMKRDPSFLAGSLSSLTGSNYDIWEMDTALSPMLVIFLILAWAKLMRRVLRKPRVRPGRPQMFALILLLLSVWITTEFSLANGIIYSTTKNLPILRSLHVNVRFVSAFIVPLIIIGAYELHFFFLNKDMSLYFFITVLSTMLFICSYFALSAQVHVRVFDVSVLNAFQTDILHGKISPVETIENIDGRQGFAPTASSIRAYEPIFGYLGEQFTPQTRPGKILQLEDGYFNMTNPASLVYPEKNQTFPFERIKETDRKNLVTFLNRGQPTWNMPLTQKILNWISVISLVACIGILFKKK